MKNKIFDLVRQYEKKMSTFISWACIELRGRYELCLIALVCILHKLVWEKNNTPLCFE